MQFWRTTEADHSVTVYLFNLVDHSRIIYEILYD